MEKLKASVKNIIGVSTGSAEQVEGPNNAEQQNSLETAKTEMKSEHLEPQNGVLSDVKVGKYNIQCNLL